MLEFASIRRTAARLQAEGYCVSEGALRRWIREEKLAHRMCGNKPLLYYPNIIKFLEGDEFEDQSNANSGTVRKINN